MRPSRKKQKNYLRNANVQFFTLYYKTAPPPAEYVLRVRGEL